MPRRIHPGGLVVAGIGFFLTRFTVTLAVDQGPLRFYLAGVVPLVLGLGLAAFGVALAVADVRPTLVRTVAVWCLLGTGSMLVLVVLTLLGSSAGRMPEVATLRSQAYLSNFLIGGGVGGVLTGVYAARNRRQRTELRLQANRMEVLNRMLRHEVLNAVTAIRGYAQLGADEHPEAREVITERADDIDATIGEVKHLTNTASSHELSTAPVDLGSCLEASLEAVRARYPGADVGLGGTAPEVSVVANERLERVFTHLLENAVVHGPEDAPAAEVAVEAGPERVRVHVSDEGPGLPASQRALLEEGAISDVDYPGSGFGLNIVRLLVESYRGAIETEVTDAGSTVTVVLRRAEDPDRPVRSSPSGLAGVRPAGPQLMVVLAAALLAGVAYGLAAEAVGGSVGIIGVLYGARSTVVGWITHEFHSVVFAFVFAGLVSLGAVDDRNHLAAYTLVGVAWGLVLWFVAAGVVSAVWLRLMGVPAPIPSLSTASLAGHLVWGVGLGALTALGYEYVVPWLREVGTRSKWPLPGP